jgi:hypothetical protein
MWHKNQPSENRQPKIVVISSYEAIGSLRRAAY